MHSCPYCGCPDVYLADTDGGEHPVFRRKGMLLSIPDAIAWVLESHYMKDVHHGGETTDLGGSPKCPECGGELVLSEGCMHCPQCGYSKC